MPAKIDAKSKDLVIQSKKVTKVSLYHAYDLADLKRARLALLDSGVSRTLVHAEGLYLYQYKVS